MKFNLNILQEIKLSILQDLSFYINSKKIIQQLLIFILIITYSITYGRDREPMLSKILNSEITSINGQAVVSGYLKIGDTLTFIQNPIFNAASIYNVNSPLLNSLRGTSKLPGDSIPFNIVINYSTNNLPFFPIRFQFMLDVRRTDGDSIRQVTEFYLFFTPYNTIEIWDKHDYPDITRSWLNPSLTQDTSRIYINPSSIPISNLEVIIREDNDSIDFDWQDNLRKITINGLAYEILMKAIPLDSLNYFSSYGDSALIDTSHAPSRKTFTGTVKGRLTTTIINDLGLSVEIPLSGIRVELYDRDVYGGEFFEGDYTDSNGDYTLYYNKDQSLEGDNVELYLKFLSHTHKAFYKILCTNAINAYYNVLTFQWNAPQNAGEMIKNYNLATSTFHGNSHPEAFRVTHWANNAYKYFDGNGVQIEKELQLNINSFGTASYYLFLGNAQWPFNIPTINLKGDDDDDETTTQHEFGHHVMYRLQGNHFLIPNGTDGFNHRWYEENTSKLAWVEGWADFVQMMLDAGYYDEDKEYGADKVENGIDTYETRMHYSYPSWDIINGFRSEYYFASALYDVWDGPNKGLPETIWDGTNMHGWNDTKQTLGWKTIDDVELSLNEICAPLLESNYPVRISEYFKSLLNSLNDNEVKAKVARAFRENLVQWNISEYIYGWHNTSLSGDNIYIQEEYDENPSGILWGPYTDTYDVNYYNKEAANSFSIVSTGIEPIFDNQHIGIWDSYSNIYRNSSLNLMSGNFSTFGQNRIYVNNGELNLGISSNSANLIEKDNSVICVRNHGVLNINSNSILEVSNGASFVAQPGSTIFIEGNGKIIFKTGSFVCIGNNVNIVLQDQGSIIEFESDVNMGLAPDILDFTIDQSCNTPPNTPYTGEGVIIYNCEDYVNYTYIEDIKINENVTWNAKTFSFKSNISIEPGCSLTVTNSNLRFNKNSKLIVKAGAKLIVDNSLLSNNERCNNLWQGIEVWGNKEEHQFPDANGIYKQGYVELHNTIIENAFEAINLWKPEDYTKTGGIIVANNSEFRNNRESVHALEYQNYHPINGKPMDYQAIFTKCTFNITNTYNPSNLFYKHIDLNKVSGVRFYGCDFNLSQNALGISNYNQAIGSYSSGFKINAICEEAGEMECLKFDPCTFTGFKTAIYAGNGSFTTNTFYINRAEFINNSIGVEVNNVWNPIIINSKFFISSNRFSTEPYSYGIYLNKSTGFAVEENSFYKAEGAPPADYLGIGVINCETIAEIYKNKFIGLSAGNYAFGKNWERELYRGLEYLCNENIDNYTDFYIAGNDPDDCVQSKQGNVTLPCGNKFSPSHATLHFYNETRNLIGYYYCTSCTNQYPELINNVTREQVGISNPCISHYGGSNAEKIVMSVQQKLESEISYAYSLTNYNNIVELYNSLEDGGSTSSTVENINNASADDMWILRAQLLGDSPHLSEEVLKLVSDKTNVFSDAVIFDVLASNPDELKKEDLINFLENKENPLPSYMIDILKQVAEGNTYKTVLHQEMSRYSHDIAKASNDMIRSILSEDSLDIIQLRTWLNNLGGIESDKQIIATYLEENNFTSALELANMLPQLYNLQGEDLDQHGNFIQLLQLQELLYNEGRSICNLTLSEQNLLNEYALFDHGTAGAASRSILESFYDQHYNKYGYLGGTTSYKNHAINTYLLSEIYGLSISVNPNPAGEYAAFDYTLPNLETSAVLTITNPEGQVIEAIYLNGNKGQKLWDTRGVVSGTYIYNIKVDGYSKSGKLLIVK